MKTRLLFMILLFCASISKAQSIETKELEIHPFGKDCIPQRIKKGDYIKTKIYNVNVFKVKGYTIAKGSDITYEIPESVISLLESAKEKETDSVISEGVNKEIYFDDTIDFTTVYKSFMEKYRDLLYYQNLENRLQMHLGDSVFIKNVDLVRENAANDYELIYSGSDASSAKRNVRDRIKELVETYSKLTQLYADLNKDVKSGTFSFSGNLTSKEKEKIKITDGVIKYADAKRFEKEFEYAKKIGEAVEYKSDSIANKAFAGIDLYYRIKEEDFVYTTDAQQVTNDIIAITPELKSTDGKVKHTFNSYTLRTNGNIKVDFSTGYLLSFDGNENYSSFTNNDGDKEIKKSKADKITQALGVLMNVYWNHSNMSLPQFGFSFGASVSEDTNIGFYGGLSALFLEKNRLVFTAGLSFVKIDQLNTVNLTHVNESGSYVFTNSADTEIRYDSVYKPAFFVGVTFNIFKSED
ncbi:hypothetical protein NHF50_05375 [Flavobacterium sp. NRK F10]|uniref:hypothetical protein n=1 Tax=Flavobacterium sp. NRK F10 TaxID=2954931 RepID=UPI002090AA2D|nr:hypothetical protein [Flavobacterium sp. NRK F10]MCO6174470.1 hypothetical protein [Flavobacterium sp. NRK F10]